MLAFSAKFRFAVTEVREFSRRVERAGKGVEVHTLLLKRTKLLGSCAALAAAAQSISIRVFFK